MTFDMVIAPGLLPGGDGDPATADLLQTVAALLGQEGLAILDSARPITTEDASSAGCYRVENLGPRGHDRTAFLLRR